MGALPRPDLPAGAHRDLVVALHDLHHRAGLPSLRRMAAAAGYSHTTVSAVFSSDRLPAWDVLSAVVAALAGDHATFHDLWFAATTPDEERPAPPALAGRREEVAALRRSVRDHCGLHLVRGEAGIGKTRLLEAVAGSHGEVVLSARCLPLSRGAPLMPFAAVLRDALGRDDGAWFARALDACAPFVRDAIGNLLPELGSPRAGDRADDEWAQQRLFVAVAMVLAALSRDRPCVVVLDDLHWADRTTLDLVEYLLTATGVPPILGAWRERDATVPLAARQWRSRVAQLPSVRSSWLGPLSDSETAEQVRLLGLDDRDTARLHARSAGLPLFTEHLARHVASDDRLPEELAELLSLRIEGLTHPAQRIAATLGVMNRPVPADLLTRLVDLPADEVSVGVRELAARHLLQPGSDQVGLGHPLLCEAVRGQLVATDSIAEHRRIAERLAAYLGAHATAGEVSAAEVAEHWRSAGDRSAELLWRVLAARVARDDWCLVEAADHWFRVLDLWPDGESELTDPPLRRSTVQLAALTAVYWGDPDRGQQLVDDAVAGLADRSDPEAGEICHWASRFVTQRGDYTGALKLIERAVAALGAAPPSLAYLDALIWSEFAHDAMGRHADGAAALRKAADLGLRLGALDRRQRALARLVCYDLLDGDQRAAAEHFAASEPDPTAAHHDPTSAVHLSILRTVALLAAEAPADAVAAAAEPGLDAARRWGVGTGIVVITRYNVAEALWRAGRVAEAVELVGHEGLDHGILAVLDLLRGRTSEAVEHARAYAQLPPDCLGNEVDGTHLLATVDLWTGSPAAALDRGLSMLERALPTDAATYAADLLAITARAAADCHADAPGGPAARRTHQRLAELLDHASHDPFAPLPTVPSRAAMAAQWTGELRRLDGHPDPTPWLAAVRHWDGIERPHDAAYCRWRAAQAAAATGQATQAARLIRRALPDARTHVPLRRALTEELNRLTRGGSTPAIRR